MSYALTPSAAPEDVVRLAARAHERDRYLTALLSPRAARSDLIALAAFAGEVGRIPLYVREPMMGRIRLQWWRERIETSTSAGHPVAAAIIATMNRHALPADQLLVLIDAHEDGLDDRPFANEAAMLAYVDRIDGSLFALAARIAGQSHAASFITDAGRAYGLARLCLELPAALSIGRILLPADGLTKTPALQDLSPGLLRIISLARLHLAACEAALRQRPGRARAPYLPLALVEPYLQALEQKQLPQGVVIDIQPLARVWALLRCRWTGKVR